MKREEIIQELIADRIDSIKQDPVILYEILLSGFQGFEMMSDDELAR
jgi:hypothetical protein